MTIRLDDTTAGAIQKAIGLERHRLGATATGMVLTMLVASTEAEQSDAMAAAGAAAREHPMRILCVIPRPGRGAPRLDAEISVGGDDGPGELAVLRLRGALAAHAHSVLVPLLLSDTPVVAWWPEQAPTVPAEDSIGSLATRRITDAAASARPLQALSVRQGGYRPGDTDLAWTRVTPWRTMVAAALDQPFDRITGIEVAAQRSNPSAVLLGTWLGRALGQPVRFVTSRGPGITAVRIDTVGGLISLTRPDGRHGRLERPGWASSEVALPRRDLPDLLAEELRRLDPDVVYGETLADLLDPTAPGTPTSKQPAGRKSAALKSGTPSPAKKSETQQSASKKLASKKSASKKSAPARKTPARPAATS